MMKRFISVILSGIILCGVCSGCVNNNVKVNTGEKNKMSENFVSSDEAGIYPGNTDCSDKVNKVLAEGKSIYFSGGEFCFKNTIHLKDAAIVGCGSSATRFLYTGNKTMFEADGAFAINDVAMYAKKVTGKEKEGECVMITLGKNGGAVKGAEIKRVQFGSCGTAVYEPEDAKPSVGLNIETIEMTDVGYAGFDFLSNGRSDNHIGNVYIGKIGNGSSEFAEKAACFAGSENNLIIDQLNVEHFRAVNSLVLSGVKNLDISSVHIEGMDIAKQGEGYIHINNTSGSIDAVSVYWSRVCYDNCSCFLLGDAGEKGNDLVIKSIQIKGVNDPASFHGQWSNRGIKSNGFKIVDRVKKASNEYRVCVEHYIPFTYQDDWDSLCKFPCDDDNIVFLKKGDIRLFGTSEQRPTDCLCKGYSKYYDTTLGKTVVYNGTSWQ